MKSVVIRGPAAWRGPSARAGREGGRRGLRAAPRRWRRGFSLFGVLLAVGVGAVALIGAVGIYNNVKLGLDVSGYTRLIGGLVTGSRQLYGGTPGYTGISAANLVNAGLVPPEFVSGTTIVAPNGRTVAVAAEALGSGYVADAAFKITLSALSEELCEGVGAGFVGVSRRSAGLAKMKVGGTEYNFLTSTTTMTETNLVAHCDANSETIELVYQ